MSPTMTSKIYVGDERVSPIVRSNVFEHNPDSRFAIGIYNPKDVVNYKRDSIEQAYLRLRANVYIDQAGFLEDDKKRQDGTELDHDDERSTHFIALENMIGAVAVIGCLRLPQKSPEHNGVLPIEEFFPEYFTTPAPNNSTEVSRLIVRHERPACVRVVKQFLMANSVAYGIKNGLGPAYGVIEEPLRRDLSMMKIPFDVIAEPKFIEKYNTYNLGIRIDQFELERRIGKSVIDALNTEHGSFNYFGKMAQEDNNSRK